MYRVCAVVVLFLGCGLLFASSNPVPFLNQPLVPGSVAPGSVGFTLTVNGAGFVPHSAVNWNNKKLTTQFVSHDQLTAAVPASFVSTRGTATVTVVNPGPGGGASNPVLFSVRSMTAAPTFALPRSFAVGSTPVDVVAADFNNDGWTDLAVVTECGPDPGCPPFVSNRDISILLGNGDGTFSTKTRLASGGYPVSAAVGDFNHDGNIDLVVISEPNCQGCAFVTVYLGRGDGSFKKGTLAMPGLDGDLSSIAVGDFNRDGNLDLAVSAVSFAMPQVFILQGNGDGTFTPNTSLMEPELAGFPSALAVGDFNNDGVLDLADTFLGNNGTELQLFAGNGDGTFTTPARTTDEPITGPPQAMAAGDFNGDGILDLAYVDPASGSLVIQLGNGDGTFSQQISQAVPQETANVSALDVNGDGILDLVVVYAGDRLSIYLGNGDGTFQTGFSPLVGNAPSGGLGVGDFDGNGQIEFAVSNTLDNTISLALQGPTTSSTLTSSENPAFAGQSLTFTATVLSHPAGIPTGNVTFKTGAQILGTAPLISGVATLSTSFATAGTKQIQAVYPGDGNFLGNSSAVLQENIVKASTGMNLTSSQNPSPFGQSVTFTASVVSPSGTPPDGELVTFTDAGAPIGTAPLSGGVAVFSDASLLQGQHSIRAAYAGDTQFKPSSSSPVHEEVF